jgi:hypothetical protein
MSKLNTRSKKALNSAVEVIARLERRKLVTSILKFYYIFSSANRFLTIQLSHSAAKARYQQYLTRHRGTAFKKLFYKELMYV